ncbi:hypothetical protein IS481_12135 [Caldimonas thermodepolymerans]|uniref:Uncharacterized protein n=1 Tax=Caldimonas thermodepolymerans TaxID=215580 RepID=A0A2S5T905_9BURK|nr:hypothetical protein [Caldimonas thermodepolymerans]PPE71490.1 hypothetical protein C1702_00355 [Caldimonas thermodepolymerans]QPC30519.1 hypothetical protein IS481_12135 [Caldimonas thermodepolymerans]RDI02894.1 hypothetical protein DES46_102322 [Caldimonas thermodepolymerans]
MSARLTAEFQAGTYRIRSYGNGWAYEVEHVASGRTVWVQDDDAEALAFHCAYFHRPDLLADYF